MDPASPHLARLARLPRPAGSATTADARDYCAGVLRTAGYAISENSFEYSAFPGSWAAPLAGAGALVVSVALFLGRHATPLLVVALVAAAVVALALRWMGGRGVLRLPLARRRGVNLQAVRGRAEPTVWLVAHLDSKRQPVSMIARVTGVVTTAIAGVALLGLNFFPIGGEPAATAVLLVACLGSIPIMLSIVRDGSYGAVDNASGVATVLEAAAALPETARVGILITDAEELALAGARAWASARPAATALNCDSIDDEGTLTVMHTTPQPRELVRAFRRAATDLGVELRIIRLLPGVMTDSVALAGAGWRTVTLSRGNARTLMRIHTSRDTLDHMHGTGIATAARVLATTALELA